jgi:GxxExxY protein
MLFKEITSSVIASAIEVHSHLGPGLFESAYQTCLMHELQNGPFPVQEQVPIPLIYKSIRLNQGYRLDVVADQKVAVEIKCVDRLTDLHVAQLLTYMRLGGYQVGLLINFNVARLMDGGVKRLVI